jgi:hypothetical protein
MAPKTKRVQNGGDELDTKLQHAVTTLNELAASLSAVLESRGASVPETDAPAPAEEEPVEETKTDAPAEDAPAEDAAETKEGGGRKPKTAKKTAKKAAPKKK